METYILMYVLISYACGAVLGYYMFRAGQARVPPAVWDRISKLEKKLAIAERQRDELLDKMFDDITLRDKFDSESA